MPDWAPGKDAATNPDHPARYTEMHPPDLIEPLSPPVPRVTVRALALVARVAATPGAVIPSCEKQEFDIFPEALRPANSLVAFEEIRGTYPEVYFPWGENGNNGSWIQALGDHVHVRAQVCGGALFGSPGRFKAFYRVWWKPAPPAPPAPNPQCVAACAMTRDTCLDRAGSDQAERRCGNRYQTCVQGCPR